MFKDISPLVLHPSIHLFSTSLILLGRGEHGVYPRRLRAKGRVHPGWWFITHTSDKLERPISLHVFGLGEETGLPRGKSPQATWRTCKLHT